jgi:hypothetical protein
VACSIPYATTPSGSPVFATCGSLAQAGFPFEHYVTSGAAPLAVAFVRGDNDSTQAILVDSIDFGDGSPPLPFHLCGADQYAISTHTYAAAGSFTPKSLYLGEVKALDTHSVTVTP